MHCFLTNQIGDIFTANDNKKYKISLPVLNGVLPNFVHRKRKLYFHALSYHLLIMLETTDTMVDVF